MEFLLTSTLHMLINISIESKQPHMGMYATQLYHRYQQQLEIWYHV